MQEAKYVAGPCPAWKAHLCLAVAAALPLVVYVPPNFNVLFTAVLTVYVGCWRSVKTQPPAETMTKKDAMRFPIVGSAVLFGLFLTFKFLPKDLVNALLSVYFMVIGIFAITVSAYPFISQLFPEDIRKKKMKLPAIKVPFLMDEPCHLELDAPEAVAAMCSSIFCIWYCATKHWFANNVLGLAFSIQGIEHLSLGSIQVGCILLGGLFFYDVFWVFCTPVMVTVAKSVEAPIKLLFPRALTAVGTQRPFAMLGLGDIVIPGIFVALVLRYDYKNNFMTSYFQSAFWGYTGGLTATLVVMNYFQAAQPALLYIVPAVLGSVFLHAFLRKEFKHIYTFSEQQEKPESTEGDASNSKDD